MITTSTLFSILNYNFFFLDIFLSFFFFSLPKFQFYIFFIARKLDIIKHMKTLKLI